MRNEQQREQVVTLIEEAKSSIVDGVAQMVACLNEDKVGDAALLANSLADSLTYFSMGLAAEALVRKLENPPGK